MLRRKNQIITNHIQKVEDANKKLLNENKELSRFKDLYQTIKKKFPDQDILQIIKDFKRFEKIILNLQDNILDEQEKNHEIK